MIGSLLQASPTKIVYPHAGNEAIEIGDLVVFSGGNAKGAASMSALGSAAADQAVSAPLFVGTSAERKLTTDGAGSLTVDVFSMSDRVIASGSYRIGDLLSFAEKGGNAGLDPNLVAKVTDPNLAIARVVPLMNSSGQVAADYSGSTITLVRAMFFARFGLDKGIGGALNPLAGIGAGYRIARGQATTATASDTVVTGLTTVVAVVASLDSAPVIGCDRGTGSIGDQAGSPAAGSILIQTWKPTATGDATPIAATTFSKKVNWIAIGL